MAKRAQHQPHQGALILNQAQDCTERPPPQGTKCEIPTSHLQGGEAQGGPPTLAAGPVPLGALCVPGLSTHPSTTSLL